MEKSGVCEVEGCGAYLSPLRVSRGQTRCIYHFRIKQHKDRKRGKSETREIICPECGNKRKTKNKIRKYCSSECAKHSQYRRQKEASKQFGRKARANIKLLLEIKAFYEKDIDELRKERDSSMELTEAERKYYLGYEDALKKLGEILKGFKE